jgi:hypothetical protein
MNPTGTGVGGRICYARAAHVITPVRANSAPNSRESDVWSKETAFSFACGWSRLVLSASISDQLLRSDQSLQRALSRGWHACHTWSPYHDKDELTWAQPVDSWAPPYSRHPLPAKLATYTHWAALQCMRYHNLLFPCLITCFSISTTQFTFRFLPCWWYELNLPPKIHIAIATLLACSTPKWRGYPLFSCALPALNWGAYTSIYSIYMY